MSEIHGILNVNKLRSHQPSLVQAFEVGQKFIDDVDTMIHANRAELDDVDQKIEICTRMNIDVRDLQRRRKRLRLKIAGRILQTRAYINGYSNMKGGYMLITLTADMPLRLFRGLEKARELGCFTELNRY